MKCLLKEREWDWKISGVALGLIFLVTVMVVKPIGVSTQFVILDGIFWKSVSSELIVKDDKSKTGYASSNAYLNKSSGKYAQNVDNPLNYSFVFVIAMIMGGFISAKFTKNKDEEDDGVLPQVWKDTIGNSTTKRYIIVFIGGVLVLYGARMAGGCSSGHMMSGMMQTSISGYLFAIATFISSVPTAMYFFSKKES
ncbi:MAG TPA: hypothetical protein EYG93_07620 [Sulfurospirillum arcachonense]|nr:hypothetical protein [Sulfurospirillum arcachonense]